MPIYKPNCDVGVEATQVLHLETAVKDGILDGTRGGEIWSMGVEKLDLKKMIEELDPIDAPFLFICPISLEPMLDPVTLCTGQTYERSNILKWFSMGNYICPTTMQELWDDAITPNKTLQQLIYTWFSQKYLAMKKRSEDVQGRAIEILEALKKIKGQARVQALKELRQIVKAHGTVKKRVIGNGGISLISSLLGNFTMHSVGSEAIGILVNLDLDSESKSNLLQPQKISLMVDMLNEGSMETKINCTKLIGILIKGKEFEGEIVSSLSLLIGLMKLVKNKKHKNGVSAGLNLLKIICFHESCVRSLIISIGVVPQLVELLPNLNSECLEIALCVLEVLSTLLEGRLALKDCPNMIAYMMKLLMGVSENCTQSSLSILLNICKLAPEECTSLVVEAGLAANLLLVIQSACSPFLKQQSVELLKLCTLNSTAPIFTSKCELTRTIQ